ncbi:UDP-3-O-(3-hydroxymyristoyl)glucosamine N-acyltransferase [Clostridium beijerinckii]|uniref:UDP-3-O-[3-hydroxymyristoyl] glucosamine N-acyltransferase n=1 Tax=Clostridium beijerinckii TaxID=1520 RepID=A0AAE5LNF0_CLOBE|nr:UDP-3-O-(3-hydroxymyristoyl)glucosamine N-acyltransferase [Clostridium beijerinckii]NSB12500.1 UDP-3-O-[3-hydroxymyristoyl] glucosamine N-acyltransferase [Clostridium beijerinckii]OOM33884.1 UDP-3-O-(3-hydroxymyristoyl)glucosamine N-acyltransferase [Clostridium beijerinckii]
MKKKFEFNCKLLKNIIEYGKQNINETVIYSVSTLKDPKDNTLIFGNALNEESIKKLKKVKNSLIILNTKDSYFSSDSSCLLYVDRPREEYAKVLDFILKLQPKDNRKHILIDGYYKGESSIIGKNTVIEPLVFIDNDVKIGDNCIIKTGAKIRRNVIIGNNCIIKENAVIGDDGFGVERDEDGTTYKIPHLGGVKICNNVEVGALSCICQGTIEPTVIEEYVKIDDCVFIAHNCFIDRGTLIIANAEISGSVHIGANSWIAPNSCIRDGTTVGDNTLVGIGAVVVNNIDSNVVVAGNPAKLYNNS